MSNYVNKMRTWGSLFMLLMFAIVVGVLVWLGRLDAFTWGAVVAMLLTAVGGSVLIAVITPKKEKLWAYINIFLIVILCNMIVGLLVSWGMGYIA